MIWYKTKPIITTKLALNITNHSSIHVSTQVFILVLKNTEQETLYINLVYADI